MKKKKKESSTNEITSLVYLIVACLVILSIIIFTQKVNPPLENGEHNVDMQRLEQPDGVTVTVGPHNQSDNCMDIQNHRFTSLEKLEMGPGGAKGNWHIELSLNESTLEPMMYWRYSDIEMRKPYDCVNNVIKVDSIDGVLEGYYDVDRDVFIWEGIEYESVGSLFSEVQ